MANKLGIADVELGGKTRKLMYDFNALCELERLTGVNMTDLQEKEMNLSFIRAALKAGLMKQHKKISEAQVGTWMEVEDMEAYGAAISECLQGFFGKAADVSTEAGEKGNAEGSA